MMKITEIFKQEKANDGFLYLHLENNFYKAYEISCYQLVTHLWPHLQVQVKYYPEQGNYVQAGFPVKSLEKVVGALKEEFPDIEPPPIKSVPDTDLTIDPLPLNINAYTLWRGQRIYEFEQASKMLIPTQAKMKVYKDFYDLASLVTSTVAGYQQNIRDTIGQQLIQICIEIERLFRQYIRTSDLLVHCQILLAIDNQLDTITFLLRMGNQMHAHKLKRHIAFANAICAIQAQLHLMYTATTKKVRASTQSPDQAILSQVIPPAIDATKGAK